MGLCLHVFLDAFDRVKHSILFQKLIDRGVYTWIYC